MKRIVAFLLCAIMCLAGCSSNDLQSPQAVSFEMDFVLQNKSHSLLVEWPEKGKSVVTVLSPEGVAGLKFISDSGGTKAEFASLSGDASLPLSCGIIGEIYSASEGFYGGNALKDGDFYEIEGVDYEIKLTAMGLPVELELDSIDDEISLKNVKIIA